MMITQNESYLDSLFEERTALAVRHSAASGIEAMNEIEAAIAEIEAEIIAAGGEL